MAGPTRRERRPNIVFILVYLFDLSKDIAEKHNLKDQYPSEFQDLKARYDQWEEATRRNRRGQPWQEKGAPKPEEQG